MLQAASSLIYVTTVHLYANPASAQRLGCYECGPCPSKGIQHTCVLHTVELYAPGWQGEGETGRMVELLPFALNRLVRDEPRIAAAPDVGRMSSARDVALVGVWYPNCQAVELHITVKR